MFLLFFETMPTEERTSLLTTFNLAHAVATATGSLVGGAILFSWGPSQNIYLALFALSAVCRAVGLLVLSLVPKSSSFGEPVSMRDLKCSCRCRILGSADPAQFGCRAACRQSS